MAEYVPGEQIEGYSAECLIMGIQLGELNEPDENGVALIAALGRAPFGFVEYGKHPNGDECQTFKIIHWEVLASLAGQIRVVKERLPIDYRDQFQAEEDMGYKQAIDGIDADGA